jgi:hypothetical protein
MNRTILTIVTWSLIFYNFSFYFNKKRLESLSDSDLTIHASPPEGLFDILESDAAETFFLRE